MQKIRDIMLEPEAGPASARAGLEKMAWGLMMQFGHNMWGEGEEYNRTEQKLWDEVTEYAAKKDVRSFSRPATSWKTPAGCGIIRIWKESDKWQR